MGLLMANRIPSELNFRVSPRVLGPLGLEQLQDPALAVLELVKNAWDANATDVTIEISQRGPHPRIVVHDNGDGMSRQDFQDRWLVIGASHKRGAQSQSARPQIGEKGLGRLASYALGRTLIIESGKAREMGFSASLDWKVLLDSASVEEYKIKVLPTKRSKNGTSISIGNLNAEWLADNTEFLVTHAQFLTSVPGERFRVTLQVDGKKLRVEDPLKAIERIAEAVIEVRVGPEGVPFVAHCEVDGVDYSTMPFRSFPQRAVDKRLAGTKLRMQFYRRDQAAKKLTNVLALNDANDLLERYQGIRVYRHGINVPPYGLTGNDWAALEKQRTSTGGPTMVPGNSQLVGALHIPLGADHLVITAGRSGFADQGAVKLLAEYVRWSVRSLGLARRAKLLGLASDVTTVPSRVDIGRKVVAAPTEVDAVSALDAVLLDATVKKDLKLRRQLDAAKAAVEEAFDRNDATLRLYAQLASTGIAATSFAHELRTDFDVVSGAIEELLEDDDVPSPEVLEMLASSWARITSFVALFKLVPVKVRRQRRLLNPAGVRSSLFAIARLANTVGIQIDTTVTEKRFSIVPAELDSIFLNLITNSVKAIQETGRTKKGLISVVLSNQGRDLIIVVADNGCGVSPKIAPIIFEPLEGRFAEGTGMGLPIVKFIVERYSGSVSLLPAPPKGFSTAFRITLKDVVR